MLSPPTKRELRLSNWLFVCCGMIFIMILLGGVTRLTGSGLSMVDWRPVTGVLPPLTENDWHGLFSQYQTSPEYKHIHFGMSLREFKGIFWLEYIHRLWGRLIGFVFLIPLGLSLLTPALRRSYSLKLLGIWGLGGLQGVMGWYMVKSGLIHEPMVSPYRLGAHLLLGFATYGLTFSCALNLRGLRFEPSQGLLYYGTFFLFSLTVLYGAFVAGLKAGLIYNTFPLMDGQIFPEAPLFLAPFWVNLFENHGTVQFIHRCFGLSTLILGALFWFQGRKRSSHRFALFILGSLVLQATLGVFTLLYQVPVALGAVHQANAVIVLTLFLIFPYGAQKRIS